VFDLVTIILSYYVFVGTRIAKLGGNLITSTVMGAFLQMMKKQDAPDLPQ